MPQPVELKPEESPLAKFGFELRRHRMAAQLTQAQLAGKIHFSTSMVGMVERAARKPERAFAERCDEVLRLDGVLTEMWAMVDRERRWAPWWFREWLQVEQEAIVLRSWDPLLIPGILQTEAYARLVLSGEPGATSELVEQRLAARTQRRGVLSREKPPLVWALIDEGVLHRPIGDSELMREQLCYLADVARHSHVKIQIVPYSAHSTCGLMSPFTVAELPGPRTIVHVESSALGQISGSPSIVELITNRYDAIRADAHPKHVSLLMVEEAMERWT
ncbi:helix-turn-helix domain-containing protein [Sphaerisporangium aureirubrum]|uniref:Scr1 family TA system antitoxin-like transcriptional regulator n=1 Tax=Sphaerisporangium aureirubrum TaxID=1544736 RepID=A0ABW1NKH3_9ACTN